jgi:hypothetical protein
MSRALAPAIASAGVLLAAAIAAAEPRLPEALRAVYDADPIPSPLTEQALVRDTIDVHAQRAILQLSRDGDNQDRAFALMIGRAAVRGTLAGIYLENTRVPILRAKALGIPWWEILPKDKRAICWEGSAGEAPVIVFDEAIRSDVAAVSLALREAFLGCGLGYLVVDAVDAQGEFRPGCATGIAPNEALGYQGTRCESCSETEPLRPATYGASAECEGKMRSAQSVVKPGEVTIEQIDPTAGGGEAPVAVAAPPKIRIPAVAIKKAALKIPTRTRSAESEAGDAAGGDDSAATAGSGEPKPAMRRPSTNDL